MLNAADLHGHLQKFFPRTYAFTQQYAVALLGVRRPVFEMVGLDAAGIGPDERQWVGTGRETGRNVELEGDFLGRVAGQDIDGARPVHRPEIHVPVVIAGAQAQRTQLLGSLAQQLRRASPAVEIRLQDPHAP